jgi:DNA-binding HxlR family transcriptional regulator
MPPALYITTSKLDFITIATGALAKKRTYQDGCAVAHALDLIGERWSLLVMRELLLGPQRFTDLRSALPDISANVLTQRLEALEAGGIIIRRQLPPPGAAMVYELTAWGADSEVLFSTIGRWAARSPGKVRGLPMSVASVVMSMRTMFSAARAGDFQATIGLQFNQRSFCARVADKTFAIDPGPAETCDVRFACDQNVMAELLYGGLDIDMARTQGRLQLSGDLSTGKRFLTLFPLPATAPAGVPRC